MSLFKGLFVAVPLRSFNLLGRYLNLHIATYESAICDTVSRAAPGISCVKKSFLVSEVESSLVVRV